MGAFLAFGVGMHLWNSYQGGFIVTAKTLHPEVWAQLNGDGGDNTGGGTSTIGDGTTTNPNDRPPYPNYYMLIEQKEDHYDKDEEVISDDHGGIFIDGNYTPTFNENSVYTITRRTIFCRNTFNRNDTCDQRKKKTYIYSIVEGSKTADPGNPGTRT